MEVILIDRKLILANAPSNIGQQVSINHAGCSAGNDTKHRLYIKRTDRGIVAYCHHCSESGFANDKSNNRLSTWVTKPKEIKATDNVPTPVLTPLTMGGRVWLVKYYCNINSDSFHGVQYEANKVALTLHNPDKDIIGYQIRNLKTNATPKYLTSYSYSGCKGDSSWFNSHKKHLVITEDYLSAYRVSQDTDFASVALLRTTVSDRTLRQIHDLNFEGVTIWLDPDDAGIEGAIKAQKKLSHYLPKETTIRVFTLDVEPKECTKESLESYLSKGIQYGL